MLLPLALETIRENLHKRIQSTPKCTWVNDQPTQDDLNHILEQGSEHSKYDPHGLRKQMLDDLQRGQAKLICKRCIGAKGLVIVHPHLEYQIPWELFGRIFQALGGAGWRFVLFANPKPRIFPPSQTEPGPGDVNGGYAWPGEPRTIVIYRLEECARVLVHEAIHAAGLDNLTQSEAEREARTETWAELFLIGVQANGSKKKMRDLWRIQSQWIADQEAILTREHNLKNATNYAWRYTNGRRAVLEELGLELPTPSSQPRSAVQNSLRFTAKALE